MSIYGKSIAIYRNITNKLDTFKRNYTVSTACKGLLSVSDQIIVSGATFLTNIVAVRLMSKEDYGIFAILLTIYFFLNHFQSALITWPLSVLVHGRDAASERKYLGSTFLQQIALSLITALVVLVFAACLSWFFPTSKNFVNGLLILSVCIIPLQVQEYIRKLLFSRLEVSKVLRIDVMYAGVSLLTLGLLVLGLRWGKLDTVFVTPLLFLGIMGSAAFLAMIPGFLYLRNVHEFEKVRYSDSLNENWNFGKWHLGSYVGSVGMIQANTWIIGAMGGVVAAGAVESARLLLAPVHLLTYGVGNIIQPLMSKKFSTGGVYSAHGLFKRLYPLWSSAIFLYCLVIMSAPKFWLSLILGEGYAENVPLVLAWCGIIFISTQTALRQWFLSAIRRPDVAMYTTAAGGLITVVATFLFMTLDGEVFGLTGRLIGELVVFSLSIIAVGNLLLKSPERA